MASGDDAIFYCKHYQARCISYANFFEQSLANTFNGTWTEENLFCDLCRCLFLAYQFNYFMFSF